MKTNCQAKCKHIFKQTLMKNENCPLTEIRLPNIFKISLSAKRAEQKYLYDTTINYLAYLTFFNQSVFRSSYFNGKFSTVLWFEKLLLLLECW